MSVPCTNGVTFEGAMTALLMVMVMVMLLLMVRRVLTEDEVDDNGVGWW